MAAWCEANDIAHDTYGEGALIEGIRPISPLDVLDIGLIHKKANAVILDTWTL